LGLSARLYLVEEDGTVLRVPKRVAEGLYSGKDALPAYAGTRQKLLEVIVSNDAGKPQSIQHTQGHYLEFDADGRVHESVMENIREAMNFAFPIDADEGNVVSLSPRRERQIWKEKSQWQPTPAELDQIVADLAAKPGTKGLASVKGVALKRAPLTYEAKAEIQEIAGKLRMLGWGISQLSEKALPGFVGEARQRSKQEPEHQFYWEAVALEGERQRELQRLRRTGKGEWVAVIQLFRHTGASSVEEAFVEHASCNGEAAAISKMKELLQKHHEKAGPGISIEARTMPSLEWEILNGRPF
jgi:hypothetical protein